MRLRQSDIDRIFELVTKDEIKEYLSHFNVTYRCLCESDDYMKEVMAWRHGHQMEYYDHILIFSGNDEIRAVY